MSTDKNIQTWVLDLLEAGRNQEAADTMREHLSRTLQNHQKIRNLLKP